MARSERDNLKRATAQAANHLANAVLDMNMIYESCERNVITVAEWNANPDNADMQRDPADHIKLRDLIKLAMIKTAGDRELLVEFARQAWELDEEGMISYL